MKKVKFITFLGISLLLIGGTYSKKHALACELVSLTNYQQLSLNIYADPTIDPSRHTELLSLVNLSKIRIKETFGEMNAAPNIIFTASKKEAKFFGANETASTHINPLSGCVVIGPKGHNIDVTAHELVHAEVLDRVGFINYLLEIPVWFNEGVALIVDHRTPFMVENIEVSPQDIENVKTKFSGSDFFQGPNIHQNYLAARMAVLPLNPMSLYTKLKHIYEGQKFSTVFTKIYNRPI